MGLIQKVKDFFNRGRYNMQTSNLNSILDHPKIAVSQEEYSRIQHNLIYYQSKFDDIKYINTDGDIKRRKLNHLPIARTAAKKIASLVYNEQAEITSDNEKVNEFLTKTLDNDRFNKNFERYLESALALGGLAMRPYVDGDNIRVAFVQAPVFLPLQSNTQDVSSAAILTKTIKSEGRKNVYYTLVEFHEWVTADGSEQGSTKDKSYYRITNELYKSDISDALGQRVNLSELYPDLEPVTLFKDLSRPLFTYLKTPGMNNKDINSPLGLSIFDNAKTTIDFINRTYDEFMWEVKMGQRRVIIPEQMTKMAVQNQDGTITFKRRFDVEQNVYTQLGGGNMDATAIKDLTTPIRSNDYITAISEGLKLFEMQVGVSTGMFSFDGKSMKTATEVVSENSDTYQMRNSIAALVEQAIKELCVSICELGKAVGLYTGDIPELKDISVNLDDGVFTDRKAELTYWMQMVTAGFAPQHLGIQKTLNVTEEEAKKYLAEINGELPPENDAELELYHKKKIEEYDD
ncbi:phage portal protein, putative, A118 family [Streptococcus gallolyticus]|uniref:Phage portal protein, putative, A118 family n=1 Tax=Streptococcus gallolyticus TaxID=315405 RepID=A0A1I7JHV3_9STRE|nr:phage portal protein [Streptococcus gallolyticus]SFC82910.1 phage portal protein, putative, A118 family [Streptococcus gallolyticus]SFU84742.1 phage portal protein, putative, A118 family [Streptococcus gallolyticus]